MTADLVTAFGQFGPLGLMILYLVWEKKGERELGVKRAEADKALAGSLAALTVMIQHAFGVQPK